MKPSPNNQNRFLLSELFTVSRFAMIGILAAVMHNGVALLLVWRLGANPFLANGIAFLLAFLVSFYGQYHWTFRCSGNRTKVMIRFFMISFTAFLVNNIALAVLLENGWMSEYLSIVSSTLVIPMFTYVVSRLWVFKDSTPRGNE